MNNPRINQAITQCMLLLAISSFLTALLSGFIGPKIVVSEIIEYGQNVLIYTFRWPKRRCPKHPGQNIYGRNVLHSY